VRRDQRPTVAAQLPAPHCDNRTRPGASCRRCCDRRSTAARPARP